MNDEIALRIYQAHIDEVGAAITARDFDLYQRSFRFPHHFETTNETVHVPSREHLQDIFDTLCAQLDKQAIPSIDRICKSASFSDARTIKGFHQSRLVRQDAIVADSFSAHSTLLLERDVDDADGQRRWLVKHWQFVEGPNATPSRVMARYLRRYPETGRPTAQSCDQSDSV